MRIYSLLIALIGIVAAFELAAACKTSDRISRFKDEAATTAADSHGANAIFKTITDVTIDVGNGTAFDAKVKAVEAAKQSIEMQYFLFGDDFAGSYMASKLLEKAHQGVKIRMIVDAKTTMGNTDFFKTLVKAGGGNLAVSYFRPLPTDVIADLQALGFTDIGAIASVIATGDPSSLTKMIASNTFLANKTTLRKAFARFVAIVATASGAVDEVPDDVAVSLTKNDVLAENLGEVFAELREAIRKEVPGARFSLRSWFDLTKWNHHKLLVVDGEYVQGGGRNMEDDYHWEKDDPLRAAHHITKYIFMDADYFVRDPAIAARALETFDAFWACATDANCIAQIPQTLETAADDATANKVLAAIKVKSAEFGATRNYTHTYEPIHAGRLTAKNAPVGYLENRMFPGPAPESLIHEEPSQQAIAIVEMIDALPQDQEIVFQNAYLFIPARIQAALMRAIGRGVKVTLQSNSPASSDLGYIARAARFQYEQLLKTGKPGQVSIYEYMTQESLHAKVWIIGETLVVGSINADPRCEFLDTGNSLVVGPPADGSPSLAAQYKTWLANLRTTLLRDHKRARAPEFTAVRAVTADVVAEDLAAYAKQVDQLKEPRRTLRKKLRQLTEEAAVDSFQDGAVGELGRKRLQTLHLQF